MASNLPPGVTDYDIEYHAAGGDPHMMSAIEAANDAFWAVIAEHYPAIKSGDFSPEADEAFASAQREAVGIWVSGNMPDFPEPEGEDIFAAHDGMDFDAPYSNHEIRALETMGMEEDSFDPLNPRATDPGEVGYVEPEADNN